MTLCDQSRQQIESLAFGELHPLRAWLVQRHASRCSRCAGVLRETRQIAAGLRRMRGERAPAGLRSRVAAALAAEFPGLQPLSAAPLPSTGTLSRSPVLGVPAGAAVLAALVAGGTLFVTRPWEPSVLKSAPELRPTLRAMSHVRSAYASGIHTVYHRTIEAQVRVLPQRMRVEYWYEAPDRYRLQVRPLPGSREVVGYDFVQVGRRAVVVFAHSSERGYRVIPADPVERRTSAFSFFPRGAASLHSNRAVAANGSEIVRVNGREARLIILERSREWSRSRWEIYVDRDTDRVVRADNRSEKRDGDRWLPEAYLSLTRFEYDRPLPHGLFRIPEE